MWYIGQAPIQAREKNKVNTDVSARDSIRELLRYKDEKRQRRQEQEQEDEEISRKPQS